MNRGLLATLAIAIGAVLGALGSGTVAPANAEAPSCEDRSARALEVIAEQSRRQTTALDRIAERLRK